MGFFSRPGSIGVELDAGTIRVVEMRGTPEQPQLVKWGTHPLPEGAMVEGMVVQPLSVSTALIELWSRLELKKRQVVLGVANQGVLVRYTTFPKPPDNKVAQMVRLQAPEYLPLPMNEVVFDYTVVGETQTPEGRKLEVMLVAARRDMLKEFLAALADAKLEPCDIDVSPLALLKILPPAAQKGTVALVNISNGNSTIVILVNGSPRLTRLMPVSLKQLAEMEECSLEQVLQIMPTDQPGDVEKKQKALYSWGYSLITEIRNSISHFRRLTTAETITQIFLSGRGAKITWLQAQLETNLGIKVELQYIFTGINVPHLLLSEGKDQGLEYAVSLGLARRGLEV